MKKLLFLALTMIVSFLFVTTAFAAETVIYENDFSDGSTLSDFTQYRLHGR